MAFCRSRSFNPDVINFNLKKSEILNALSGATGIISSVSEENKEHIFYMLLFCLCVPQSKALKAQIAVDELRELDFLNSNLDLQNIKNILRPNVRFYLTKSQRIMDAKIIFPSLWLNLKAYYSLYEVTNKSINALLLARDYLTKSVNGLGYKASSHFLRNIGMSGLCILDTHIYDGLVKRKLLDKKPKAVTIQQYKDIEFKMMKYADKIGLTVDELDMLWWSDKTGYVFK